MDALLNDPKLHSGLVAVLVAAGIWFVKREVARIDKALAGAVRRDELKQLRQDMDRRHEENSGRLERIETGVTGTHQRIDQLYCDLMDKLK